jgi:hypothetical protein
MLIAPVIIFSWILYLQCILLKISRSGGRTSSPNPTYIGSGWKDIQSSQKQHPNPMIPKALSVGF